MQPVLQTVQCEETGEISMQEISNCSEPPTSISRPQGVKAAKKMKIQVTAGARQKDTNLKIMAEAQQTRANAILMQTQMALFTNPISELDDQAKMFFQLQRDAILDNLLATKASKEAINKSGLPAGTFRARVAPVPNHSVPDSPELQDNSSLPDLVSNVDPILDSQNPTRGFQEMLADSSESDLQSLRDKDKHLAAGINAEPGSLLQAILQHEPEAFSCAPPGWKSNARARADDNDSKSSYPADTGGIVSGLCELLDELFERTEAPGEDEGEESGTFLSLAEIKTVGEDIADFREKLLLDLPRQHRFVYEVIVFWSR
ncbi:hypothetical protein R1sor_017809 [Riccia sorocarpa]|uniref:Uncharacterized protein n=1 Tax=Riccia sorocarpa TaxID=122646 RepID=A0ABD3IAP1_9MARC